jgi:hypothetical protein
MTSTSIYFVFACLLILNCNIFGFNIERELCEDESDSLDDEQREILNRRPFRQNMRNINAAYMKDTFNVYFMRKKIDGASAMSFQTLDYGYAKDNWSAYFMGKKIDGASAMPFQTIRNGYAKDNWSLYYKGKKMSGISPSSFSANSFGK